MPVGHKGFQEGNTFGKTSWQNRRSYKGEEHPRWGAHHTNEAKDRIRKARENENNWSWKGDDAGYAAMHGWVKKYLPKPKFCPKCGGQDRRIELSNTGHTYKRNLVDWEWLCSRCHFQKDGRERNLKQYANAQ